MDYLLSTIVILGVLVFVHEFGHFIAAKLCGMRVDVFSIGFPPRAFGKKIGDTDYCVSWIPFGGYVKIAGMIDESFDTEFLNKPPQPWEFRAKPIWQRIIVISAGVIMNVVLALGIYSALAYVHGRTVYDTTEVGFVFEGSVADSAGFKKGDRVLSVNGKPVADWDALRRAIYLENIGNDLLFTVEREGRTVHVRSHGAPLDAKAESDFGLLPAHFVVVVKNVTKGLPAEQLGLQPHDSILTLGGRPVQAVRIVEMIRSNAGKPLAIEWKRGNNTLSGTITPTAEGKIGIEFSAGYAGPIKKTEYSVFEAIGQGARDVQQVVAGTISGVVSLIRGKVSFSESLAGPIRIGKFAKESFDVGIEVYLQFMGLLSISLAILNILPIPALDGGHLIFLIVEGIIGRELPTKLKLAIQRTGFVLLLAFMAFAVYNDIRNF
jgi:regulator of sigma E protease